jgi:NADH-quinone oxidoreductase subunit G
MLAGTDNFYAGMDPHEHRRIDAIIQILREGPSRTPSLREIREADAVLVLGEDVTNTAPLLALALRQAVRQKAFETASRRKIHLWADAAVRNVAQDAKSPLFISTPHPTRLDDVATRTWHAAPDHIATLGFAIAHALDPRAPAPEGLPPSALSFVQEAAAALRCAQRAVIVSGTGCHGLAVIQAAANISRALKGSALTYAVPECNSLGLGLLGGRTLDEAFTRVRDGLADTVIIVENDLYRRGDAAEVDAFLDKARAVIVLDHYRSATAARAHVVLPAATFAECTGTYVSSESRAQRSFQVFVPPGEVRAAWKWIDAIMVAMPQPSAAARPATPEDIVGALVRSNAVFAPLRSLAAADDTGLPGQKVPRQPHRYSGRTAMHANASVHEPRPTADPETPLAFSMEGTDGIPPAGLVTRYWSPGWNSVQALNAYQREVGGPLAGDAPGHRLIEPSAAAEAEYFPAAALKDNDYRSVPRYQIFGSEELSALAPSIVGRKSMKRA